MRETLNCRLHEGEPGSQLVAWLNAEPAVQAVLAEHFEGRPINAQNLSDWRRGGYADWCQQEQVMELAVRLQEEGEELDEVTGPNLTRWLAQASALAVLGQLRATGAMEEGPPKLRAVLAVVRAGDRLRRNQLEEERAKRENDRADREVRTAEIEEQRLTAESSRLASVVREGAKPVTVVAPLASLIKPLPSQMRSEAALISSGGRERRGEEMPVRRAA